MYASRVSGEALVARKRESSSDMVFLFVLCVLSHRVMCFLVLLLSSGVTRNKREGDV